MKSPLCRVDVIGAGQRGTGLSHILSQLNGYEITSVSYNLPFRLEKSQEWASTKRAVFHKDYRRLLDRLDVDAVILATPLSKRKNIALDAISAGKHIYCEKTMAMGVESIQALKKMR